MAEYTMENGMNAKLEVFEDKVLYYNDLKSKNEKNIITIPYSSLHSIESKKSSKLIPGFIKFKNKKNTGLWFLDNVFLFWKPNKDYTFLFNDQDELYLNIKEYIEKQLNKINKEV